MHPQYHYPMYQPEMNPDAPLLGAGPVEAYKRFWVKGLQFTGRASRSEYWWAQLWHVVIFVVLVVLWGVTMESQLPRIIPGVIQVGYSCFFFGILIPMLALSVRRLHDTDTSGLFILLNFIPFIGWFINFILALLPSDPAGVRFDRYAIPVGYYLPPMAYPGYPQHPYPGASYGPSSAASQPLGAPQSSGQSPYGQPPEGPHQPPTYTYR